MTQYIAFTLYIFQCITSTLNYRPLHYTVLQYITVKYSILYYITIQYNREQQDGSHYNNNLYNNRLISFSPPVLSQLTRFAVTTVTTTPASRVERHVVTVALAGPVASLSAPWTTATTSGGWTGGRASPRRAL